MRLEKGQHGRNGLPMVQKSTIAAIRFGYGFRPGEATVGTADALLAGVAGKDAVQAQFRIASTKTRAELIAERRAATAKARKGEAGGERAKKRADGKVRNQTMNDVKTTFQRAIASRTGFRERLVAFWTDHFTVAANGPVLSALVPDLVENAIRPHVGGRFGDMLEAVTLHPAMLIYLNQVQSAGPNSVAGKRRGKGLNENLAREVLELHTLGVGAGYTQDDVRQLAELLTGLSVDKSGFTFRSRIAEPGAEVVLGKRYGGGEASLGDIRAVLADIAVHPDTARHLARKLIVHFVGGEVPEDWVEAIAKVYQASGGDLMATYGALLEEPRAWAEPFNNVKRPFDFMISALRAAQAPASVLDDLKGRELRQGLMEPLMAMGQPLFRPNGPDGWAEAPEAWITPATLAARLQWSGAMADRFLTDVDPRGFLDGALADAASPFLKFAVAGSESRAEGVALALASPEFNRR
ncbi:MAG: DUF1800 family protein [Boseongicola sp.]|nr:MAG: DUF1800 family protein [Boseongicola sp.]